MLEWLNEIKLRLRTLFRRRQLEKDLEDEVAFHLAMREEQLREAGTADPNPAARRKFGNATRLIEECREAWTFAALERFWADIRTAMRLILKNRWAMLAITLSLAMGIGSTAAVFNLFDFFVLRSFPVPETGRVVRIAAVSQSNLYSRSSYPVSNLDFEDLRDRARSFDGVASIAPEQLPGILTRPEQHEPRPVLAALVSGGFFSTLRVEPVIGREFTPEEDRVPGRDAVAVISYNLWQREYAQDSGVLGQTIRVNSKAFTIIGVAPEPFYGIEPVVRPDVYLPRTMEGLFGNGSELGDRSARRLRVLARLKPGVTIEQARDEIARIGNQIQQEHLDTNRGQRMSVDSQLGYTMATTPEAFAAAGVFFIVAGLVLAIACVNVANLLLSTAPARTREMAIRVAMGAGRGRLVRQMLVESVIVSLAGTFSGLILAGLFARFITSIEIFSDVPIKLELAVDTRVAWFALVVGVVAGMASGIIPALRCSRSDLNGLLKSADTHISNPGKMRIRQALVVLQVAVAVVVLLLSGFSIEQLRVLRVTDPGFRVDHVWRAGFFLTSTSSERSYRTYLDRVRKIPGVRAAAVTYPEPLMLPGMADESTNLVIDGYPLPPDQTSLQIRTAVVSEGYFDTLGIKILQGRAFDARDEKENRRVAIINETMAGKYWPNRDPLGGRIRTLGVSFVNDNDTAIEVIGVAKNTKYRSMSEEPMPFLYMPMKEENRLGAILLAYTDMDSPAFASTLRRELNAVDPGGLIPDVSTMSQHVRQQSLIVERIMSDVMTEVAGIGLVLSVLGLYGVIAYSVSQRSHEIGIRIAVGATAGRILRMVLGQGLKLGVIGTLAGAFIAFEVTRLAQSILGPRTPGDLLVYAMVVALSLAVTFLACYLPARRASLVDPNTTLRAE